MGKKTRLTLLMLLLGLFTMATVAFFFTSDFGFHGAEDEQATATPSGEIADGTYQGSAEGYGGPIDVEVTVEGGQITAVDVLNHSETEGLGDVALEEISAAVVAQGSTDGVEVVSGATSSSNGIIEAIHQALASAGGGAAAATSDAEANPDYTDGTYEATVDGYGGDLVVEVVLKDGFIDAINIKDHSETEGLGDKALEIVAEDIKANNGTEGVDTVSGATSSSKAMIEAVNATLGASQAVDGEDKETADDVTYEDGTYEAEVDGFHDKVKVEVVVKDGAISEINIIEQSETEGLGDKALEEIADKIVENKGTDGVETVSGATVSSQAMIDAVVEALKDAEK